ncbi:hypothetical protein [Pseudomonas sp.]|uniref:hypothetical protein n=1 Tax=Pseudomonas sp. TaxID=306 RepID=UPI0025852AF1|nr:hypothetical protein [Pseudomonas sp.]
MAGLLDFATTPAGQGLLAAGFAGLAGANRNTPINNIGRAGLAGLTGYTAAGALQEKTRKRQEAEKIKAAIPGLYGTDENGNTTFDWKGAAAIIDDPAKIAEYANLPNVGRAEVKRTIDVTGANGQKQTMQYDAYGRPVGSAIDSYVAPQLVDTGASKQFVTPQAGQAFAMGMSPSERDASNRGWANVDALKDANSINRTATRTDVFKSSNGTTFLIDKGTGQVRPLTAPDGSPLSAGGVSESKLTEGEGKASLYLSSMRDASNALDTIGGTVSPAAVAATGTPLLNWAAGGTAQKAAQAQRQWSEGYLRAKTGAAATADEVSNNIKTFFPVFGDSPEVIQRKAEARAQAERDMEIPAGRGAERAVPRASKGKQSPPQAAAPQAGSVVDGYRFKGGNPADPSNWEMQ